MIGSHNVGASGSKACTSRVGGAALALALAAVLLPAAPGAAQSAAPKLSPIDVGHGIQAVLTCADVDRATARWTISFTSSQSEAAPIQWDARVPSAPLTWTLGLNEGIGGWVFGTHTAAWPFALAYSCETTPPPVVTIEPLPGYDWAGRRVPPPASVGASDHPSPPPRVAAAPIGLDAANTGDVVTGTSIGPANISSAGMSSSPVGGAGAASGQDANQSSKPSGDPAGVGVRARDADNLFEEVLPGLDRTFVTQLSASSGDAAVLAPQLSGSLDERNDLEAVAVGNCVRERPVFIQLMRQFDQLHKQLALSSSGLRPYGLAYAAVPQAVAVKAAVLEAEIARYTWLCAEHTVGGDILMRRAVSEYLFASTWARLAGSPGMFSAYEAAAFSLAGHIPKFGSIRGFTYGDVATFCTKNSPEQSRLFPDGGALVPVDVWHKDCDAFPS